MTQTEALKLALEALETYHGYMEPLLTVFGGPRVPAEKSTTYKVEKAITAIKEALAQQSPQRSEDINNEQVDKWLQDGGLLYRLTDEQKPKNRDEINVTMANSSRSLESRTRRAGELLDLIRATHLPVPTAQPKPLTQEVIERDFYGRIDFVRQVEAAHNIKENT